MSGPKVVRIVTREEILALCEGQLARVDAALAEWIRIGKRKDCINETEIAAAKDRRDALAALIAADRFLDLQKQAPIEEAFLRRDLQERLVKVAAEEAAARSRSRREKEAGRNLLNALAHAGVSVNTDDTAQIAAGNAAALAAGFALLGARGDTQNQVNREQAVLLGAGQQRQTFDAWLVKAGGIADDPTITRIETRIVELETIGLVEPLTDWQQRLEEAASTEGARRGLLLDALEVETGRALSEARRRVKQIGTLHGLIAEAEAARLDVGAWSADIQKLDIEAVAQRIKTIQAALDAHRATAAAADRRAAVLEALAGLGYEVREEMSASWVENGQLVLSNPSRPGYGMELTGGAGKATERIQMRAVAFGTGGLGPDPGRDRDAETIWCGDVTRLRERLAETGGEIAIERARRIGEVPLKRIAVEGLQADVAREAPAPRGRTLPGT
ncbi:MAG: hypothetical protein AB7E69_16105 [Sphingomonadales bacterium]